MRRWWTIALVACLAAGCEEDGGDVAKGPSVAVSGGDPPAFSWSGGDAQRVFVVRADTGERVWDVTGGPFPSPLAYGTPVPDDAPGETWIAPAPLYGDVPYVVHVGQRRDVPLDWLRPQARFIYGSSAFTVASGPEPAAPPGPPCEAPPVDWWLTVQGSDTGPGGVAVSSQATAVARLASGDVAAAGFFRSATSGFRGQRLMIVRATAGGRLVWQREPPTPNPEAFVETRAVGVAPDGEELVVVAEVWREASGPERTAWLLRLDRAGGTVWERFDAVAPKALVALGAGRFALVGQAPDAPNPLIFQELDAWGDVVTEVGHDLGGGALADVDGGGDDGGLYLAGAAPGPGGGTDATVWRLDDDGALVWRRQVGGACEDRVMQVAAHPDGGAVVAGDVGKTTGVDALWLARFDAAGALLWEREALAGVWVGRVLGDLRALPGGDLVLAARVPDFAAGGPAWLVPNHAWVARTDPHGVLRWEAPWDLPAQGMGDADPLLLSLGDRLVLAGAANATMSGGAELALMGIAPDPTGCEVEAVTPPPPGTLDCARADPDARVITEADGRASAYLHLSGCGMNGAPGILRLEAPQGALTPQTLLCAGEDVLAPALPAGYTRMGPPVRLDPPLPFSAPARVDLTYPKGIDVDVRDELVLLHAAPGAAEYAPLVTARDHANGRVSAESVAASGSFAIAWLGDPSAPVEAGPNGGVWAQPSLCDATWTASSVGNQGIVVMCNATTVWTGESAAGGLAWTSVHTLPPTELAPLTGLEVLADAADAGGAPFVVRAPARGQVPIEGWRLDPGDTLTGPLDVGGFGGVLRDLQAAAGGGRLAALAWLTNQDPRAAAVVTVSDDGGGTWRYPHEGLNPWPQQSQARLAVDGTGGVHVALVGARIDQGASAGMIFYQRGDGDAWSEAIALADADGGAEIAGRAPALAVSPDGQRVWLTFEAGDATGALSTDGGASFAIGADAPRAPLHLGQWIDDDGAMTLVTGDPTAQTVALHTRAAGGAWVEAGPIPGAAFAQVAPAARAVRLGDGAIWLVTARGLARVR